MGRGMPPRLADAALAVLYMGWRWVSGWGPSGTGGFESDWCLPDGVQLAQVGANDWEFLAVEREGKYSIRALPHFTADDRAAWGLVEFTDSFELRKDRDGWHCTFGGAQAQGNTAALAISRAAFKAAKGLT